MRPSLTTLVALSLLLAPAATLTKNLAGQTGDHNYRVHVGKGEWVSPDEAAQRGFMFYKDRWVAKKLATKLARWERLDKKVKGWKDAYRVKSKHYRIKTNAPRYIIELEVKPFLDELYRTYVRVYKEDFGLRGKAADKNHIHIYWGFKTWLREQKSDRSGPGFYDPGVALEVMFDPTDPDDFYDTVFHEGAHQFFMAMLPGAALPVWLDEALATYFESCKFSRSKLEITNDYLPLDRLVGAKADILAAKRAGKNLSPQEMFMKFTDIDDFTAEHYGLAWSFLHFLIHREDGKHKKEFYKFLKKMNGSGAKPVYRVFKEATKKDLAKIAEGWIDYVLALESPPVPELQVLTPKQVAASEDVKARDILLRINGHRIETETAWAKHWGGRDKTKPCKLLLLRQFNRVGPLNYEQKYVTLIVEPGSKLVLEAVSAVPRYPSVVD